MTKNEYEAEICRQWEKAEYVPLRKVCLNGWNPKASECHANVDFWIKENQNFSPVRGWINNYPIYGGVQLVSHSVIEDAEGNLFDITPFENESLRGSTRFVRHIGNEKIFDHFRNKFLACQVDIVT